MSSFHTLASHFIGRFLSVKIISYRCRLRVCLAIKTAQAVLICRTMRCGFGVVGSTIRFAVGTYVRGHSYSSTTSHLKSSRLDAVPPMIGWLLAWRTATSRCCMLAKRTGLFHNVRGKTSFVLALLASYVSPNIVGERSFFENFPTSRSLRSICSEPLNLISSFLIFLCKFHLLSNKRSLILVSLWWVVI